MNYLTSVNHIFGFIHSTMQYSVCSKLVFSSKSLCLPFASFYQSFSFCIVIVGTETIPHSSQSKHNCP